MTVGRILENGEKFILNVYWKIIALLNRQN